MVCVSYHIKELPINISLPFWSVIIYQRAVFPLRIGKKAKMDVSTSGWKWQWNPTILTSDKLTENSVLFLSCSFPNKMVLGRTHIKDVAAKRKVELNSYIQSLMNSSPEVAEVSTQNLNQMLVFKFWCFLTVKLTCNIFSKFSVILFIPFSIHYFVMTKWKE